ncbi:MAG: xanthine dehydrogenase small subunit [Woeseiaceae bacterium]|nr:xanthine dehydrogenase small subunit [Woeseiaceae bacterium]
MARKTSSIDSVRFVLDGELIELSRVDPTRTVLQFLREDARRTGTKEGCAEGDCGACTVVVGELTDDGDDLTLRAVNSCIQFLPTLDGKELITVESLSPPGTALHPVQRAMVDCHGSQCGFCTPGFVMSLFALYKTETDPDRVAIDDALAGNLCRCTGYRPIIAAAERMYEYDDGSDWLSQSCRRHGPPRERIEQLRSIQHDDMLAIEHGGRRFFAPRTVEGVADLLARYPQATLLAGGTDVGLWVTKDHAELDTLIYTGRVADMQRIGDDGEQLEIGAAVTFSDAFDALVRRLPELDELLKRFASPPIRNAATLGGNVANGSPIGDSMPALMVLGATLVLRSAAGSRELPLEQFYKDYRVNALARGEFVEALRVPLPSPGDLFRTYKISKRFDQDISAVCAAFRLSFDGDSITDARIAFGGMAATIRRAPGCERSLAGKALTDSSIESACAALARDFKPIDDMRATADYRLRVAQNLLRRLLLESSGELPTSVYRYGRAG